MASSGTLTPTHTTKSGKRIRYYISRCFVTGKAKDHPNPWRLPAVALEDQIAALVAHRLSDRLVRATLLPNATATDLKVAQARLDDLMSARTTRQPDPSLSLIKRVALKPDQVVVSLDPDPICAALDCALDQIDPAPLTWSAPLALKRRGVETRLIIGSEQASVDPTLIRNIQNARNWYQGLIAGQSYSDLAKTCGIHRDHIKKMICLAFLAPDLLARITTGTQPSGFNAAWVKKNGLPADWDTQRALFKTP